MRNDKVRSDLSEAIEGLRRLCVRYEDFSNKDIRRLTADINAIIEKYGMED